MSEELRRALYASNAASLDIELFIPDLVGVTEILSEEHRKKLCRHLPARAEGNKYSSFGIYICCYLYFICSPPPLLYEHLKPKPKQGSISPNFLCAPHSSTAQVVLQPARPEFGFGSHGKNTSKLPRVSGPDEEEKTYNFFSCK